MNRSSTHVFIRAPLISTALFFLLLSPRILKVRQERLTPVYKIETAYLARVAFPTMTSIAISQIFSEVGASVDRSLLPEILCFPEHKPPLQSSIARGACSPSLNEATPPPMVFYVRSSRIHCAGIVICRQTTPAHDQRKHSTSPVGSSTPVPVVSPTYTESGLGDCRAIDAHT